MISFLRLLLAFVVAMLLLPEWSADAAVTAAAAAAGAAAVNETSNHMAWMFGLISGVAITIAARVHWRDLPHRLAEWVRGQSKRAGWAVLGMCYAWVLLFY